MGVFFDIRFSLKCLKQIRHNVTIYEQMSTICLAEERDLWCANHNIGQDFLGEITMGAENTFRKYGGQLRMKEAINQGISRYMLYSLRDRGVIEQVSRGIYRLVDMPPISNPDLVTVSLRFPNAVICLISALAYHEITTQISHAVSVAVPRDSRMPSLDYPPVHAYRFSHEAYGAGIEEHRIDNVTVKVYSPEKTLADCFKYRNKIGMDVVLEAIRFYHKRGNIRVDDLMRYADICRVTRIIRPYLEALL